MHGWEGTEVPLEVPLSNFVVTSLLSYFFVQATTQKTLFECFGDLLFEDNSNSTSNLPQAEGISDSVSSVAFEAAPSPQCECSSDLSTTGNMSNWFDELDENDFNLIDMNM